LTLPGAWAKPWAGLIECLEFLLDDGEQQR
jgi:hypothetical protein